MNDECYVKTMLYAYPKLEMLAESFACGARNKAMLSFRSTDTFGCLERIVDDMNKKEALLRLQEGINEALSGLSEYESFLLEYKYFRRKKVLQERFSDMVIQGSERDYYRKQNALLKKIAGRLNLEGFTRERFLQEYLTIAPFPRVYKAVLEGKEKRVVKRRKRREISFAKTPPSREEASCREARESRLQ